MKFGHWYASVGPFAYPDGALQLATAAEQAGFESLWTGEHIVVPSNIASTYPYSRDGKMAGGGQIPMAEPFVWHAWVAAHTTTLRLATGVLVLPQRQPLLVAKQAATLAVLCDGRFSLGLGVGWLREEFDALGADFEDRAARHDEYVTAMRSLWANDAASFAGEHIAFEEVALCPRPPGNTVPIVVGGHTPAAARRAGRVGDGFFPAKGTPEFVGQLFDLARSTAEASGRDPSALELSVYEPGVLDPARAESLIQQWAGVGASRIIVSPKSLDPGQLADHIYQFGEEVIAHV
ncbi:MAG: LLM class F420-dependent oxidoreductase [Pseudomonadota bacterium]